MSDKGSYYNQKELLEQQKKESTVSSSAKKLQLEQREDVMHSMRQPPHHAMINDGGHNFEKNDQLTVVDPEMLEKGLTVRAVCKDCGAKLELLEKHKLPKRTRNSMGVSMHKHQLYSS